MAEEKTDTTLKAEYPMFSDYDRLAMLLFRADLLGIEVMSLKAKKIREYYSVLKAIYRNISPLLHERKDIAEGFNKRFSELDEKTLDIYHKATKIGEDYKLDYKIMEKLETLHNDLMVSKQLVGLGILVRREFPDGQKVMRAMGLDDND